MDSGKIQTGLMDSILQLEPESYQSPPPEGGHFAMIKREHFESAPVVEATDALRYYYEEHAEEEPLGPREFPSLIPPIEGMVFIEGVTEGWVSYPDHMGGKSREARVGYAVLRMDRPEIERHGLPQLSIMDKTGAMASIHVQPFWEEEGHVHAFPRMWMVPLRADGRAALPARGNPYLATPGASAGSMVLHESRSKVGEATEKSTREILGGALFVICCLNAVSRGLVGYEGEPSLQISLRIEKLKERLERKGKASRAGLGHALTVCREEFRG